MTSSPIGLDAALASFDDLWNPRIVTRVNDYDVRVAKVAGDFVWHSHDDTDEFFLVLDGELTIALRPAADEPETAVVLRRGDVFVVPRGMPHRPSSSGASILLFEPTGTVNTGDHDGDVPGHITRTTGQELPAS
ncbi:cupin domain-containing protein [Jiangella endophytica]|uniref:cupin domain-containing protein n=1 Tax=Jiangella endophytica TaxID=1623398 RepID=UPI000E34717C|nr:cupin domain-containing protein [Jiangella endophytica]